MPEGLAPAPQMAPEAWDAAGRRLDVAGRTLFVADSGAPATAVDSPPVLALHGFPTSSWDWHKIWPRLSAHHRCVAPDLLGFGFSDKPRPHAYSIHEQADLVEALTARLDLPPVHLLAHDYGDTVAQELLARDNARAPDDRRLITVSFLNGGLFPETHRPRLIQKLLLSPIGPLVNRLTTKRTFERTFSAVFGPETKPGADELDAFWSIIERHDGRFVFSSLITYMRDRRRHRSRWLAALVDAPCPIQLINGSEDPVSGAHMVARYRKLVRADDPIVEMPGIGHYPQSEAPEQVAAAYLDFIDSGA